jgi:hypothetical protein
MSAPLDRQASIAVDVRVVGVGAGVGLVAERSGAPEQADVVTRASTATITESRSISGETIARTARTSEAQKHRLAHYWEAA